jgi:hypothetical protein
MKTLLCTLLCAAPLLAQAPEAAIRPTSTIRLFNGRNLEGWYTWLKDARYQDPRRVFTVEKGKLHISGDGYGGVGTRHTYRDYHLVVEYRWGQQTWGDRKTRARDSGVLVHGTGEDGAFGGSWPESIEAQMIEGGTGDMILVGGRNKPTVTVESTIGANGELYWKKGGTAVTRNRGRIDWWGRDPKWRDELNFRGPQDVEKPVGKWNRLEVIADGDTLTYRLNGVVVNQVSKSSHTSGRLMVQTEGAELFVRKVELRPLKKR